MSNGERLILLDIVRNSSLWSDIVFEKSVIFHKFDFETSDLELEVSKSSIWLRTTSCYIKGVFFLSLLSRNFDDLLNSNFHRFVILCICWGTPSEKNGLWQLPIVSSVFNQTEADYGSTEQINNMHLCIEVRYNPTVCRSRLVHYGKLLTIRWIFFLHFENATVVVLFNGDLVSS